MSLPTLTRQQWDRLGWYGQMRWRAARHRELREAAAEHEARYGALDQVELVHERRLAGDERVAEIEWLLGGGTAAAEIVRRIGPTAHALERAMQRRHRPDLAAVFSPLALLEQRITCPDCGRLISNDAARCVSCANKARRGVYTKAGHCARSKLAAVLTDAEATLRTRAHKAAWNREAWGGAEAYLAAVEEAKGLVAAAKHELERHERSCSQCGFADTRRTA